ncbi:MAG: Dabb family protein, partial [Flavobacteriales bacterium]
GAIARRGNSSRVPLNNSPEGLNKGFTHCFLVTFDSEEDRAVYLPHPAHKAFIDILSPHLDDVLVIDYWN